VIVVAACDGEPLWTSSREAAIRYPAEVVAGGHARGARTFVVASDAAAVALAAHVGVVRVPEVLGCSSAEFLAHKLERRLEVIPAADLIRRDGARLVGVAGAVAHAGVRFVRDGATVDEIVEGAGAAEPSWVAVASLLSPRALEREAVFLGSTLIVLPGEHPIARAARGDRSALPADHPRGVPAAWLGPHAGEAPAPLSIALVSRRLGFEPA
jgi:hypothetical protein